MDAPTIKIELLQAGQPQPYADHCTHYHVTGTDRFGDQDGEVALSLCRIMHPCVLTKETWLNEQRHGPAAYFRSHYEFYPDKDGDGWHYKVHTPYTG